LIAAWLLLAAGLAPDTVHSFKVAVARGESLHVATVGHGETVVLIPGFFGAAFGFRKLVPLLERAGYRSVIVEPLGTGSSGRPEHADYSLSAQAGRIAAALDSLGVQHAWVIAHSVGGAIAMRVAYRRPDLVRALVSLEGGPTEQVATREFRRAARYIPWIKVFGGIQVIRRVVRRTLIASSGDASWVTDAVVQGYTAGAAADIDGTLKAYLAMATAREHDRLQPHLVAIVCPVRLMLGLAPHDGSVGQYEVDELRASVSSFTADSIAGAGHYLQEERPDAIVIALEKVRNRCPWHDNEMSPSRPAAAQCAAARHSTGSIPPPAPKNGD
jgi:pimeloyl-ACP methyl ester carboxylesterase